MSVRVALLFDRDNDWIRGRFSAYRVDRDDVQVDVHLEPDEVRGYDIVFILGYTKILPTDFLDRNGLSLVVHESDLPRGRGFAPVQWQLLEGSSEVPVCLIEAVQPVDSGDIVLQDSIRFDGSELYEEIRAKQAEATERLVTNFIHRYPDYERRKQTGPATFYRRRAAEDGELDIDKSIIDNFNLLRIGNNDAWPSFFRYKGKKYVLKIHEGDD